VDQSVYGRVDTVRVAFFITNISDSIHTVPLCCCGVDFFAVRDSSCELGAQGCSIAGCDGCSVCFPGLLCEEDPCIAFDMTPGETREFHWNWDRTICEGDFQYDPVYGNVGTYRIIAGYNDCETGRLVHALSIPIEVLKAVPVEARSWGGIKERYGAPDDHDN